MILVPSGNGARGLSEPAVCQGLLPAILLWMHNGLGYIYGR